MKTPAQTEETQSWRLLWVIDSKSDAWRIHSKNRTSGKSGGHICASWLSEYTAKILCIAANDGGTSMRYRPVSPAGEVFDFIGKSRTTDNKLECKIVNGKLRIEIGISTLKFAAEHCDDNPRLKIKSGGVLAADVISELTHEGETGETLLTDLFDKAVTNAHDNGSAAFTDEEVPI